MQKNVSRNILPFVFFTMVTKNSKKNRPNIFNAIA